MTHFFSNLNIVSWNFFIWYAIGLGPILFLLPLRYKREAFLLAPFMGMSLLILVGLFKITVLLTPLAPRTSAAYLVIISISTCLWYWRSYFKIACRNFYHLKLFKLGLIPALFLLASVWMFHNEGFCLLTGGSDQLQYCQNAKQMLEEMHTGSAADVPVPRQNYFVYEMNTRTMPYLKGYRRGAETLLATSSALTQLQYEEAYPATILSLLLTLGLVLGFISRIFLRFSMNTSIILQVTFLSSFYLLLLQVQGSLALITSLAPGLMTLTLLTRISRGPSWRWLLLAAISVATYLAIYIEPALINILLPSLLLIFWQFRLSTGKGYLAAKRFGFISLIVLACAPFAVYSAITSGFGNANAVYQQAFSISEFARNIFQQWQLAPTILGLTSYYDLSSFNNKMAILTANDPWLGLLAFFILCICGLLGYLKTKNRQARLFSIVLSLWALVSILFFLLQKDSLRFTRSLHYAIPFALIGLVALASDYRWPISNSKARWPLFTWFGKFILISFVLLNVYTNTRTIHYFTTFNSSNDPILLHFNEEFAPWKILKNELQLSAIANNPVLLSGFKDTIRPFAIACTIHNQPHVLGSSMNFWSIYSTPHQAKFLFHSVNIPLSEKKYLYAQLLEDKPWAEVLPQLVKRSEQAVVPVGDGFPVEWLDSKDIYPHHVKRIPNIGDVVYRNRFDVNLPPTMTSELKHDSKGLYRVARTSGLVIINENLDKPHKISLSYEGKPGDIKLKIGNHYYQGYRLSNESSTKIEAQVSSENKAKIMLIVIHSVKLRKVEWTLVTQNQIG